MRLVMLLPVVLLAASCGGGAYYHNEYYPTFDDAMAAAARDDQALAESVHQRDRPVAGPLRVLLPSEDYLYSLTSKKKYYDHCGYNFLSCRPKHSSRAARREAISLRQNHRSTVEAIRRSNLFASVEVETYETPPAAASAGSAFQIVCCEWMLYKPGSGSSGQPLPFEMGIEPRSERMNQWLDNLEQWLRADETTVVQ